METGGPTIGGPWNFPCLCDGNPSYCILIWMNNFQYTIDTNCIWGILPKNGHIPSGRVWLEQALQLFMARYMIFFNRPKLITTKRWGPCQGYKWSEQKNPPIGDLTAEQHMFQAICRAPITPFIACEGSSTGQNIGPKCERFGLEKWVAWRSC